LVGWFFKSVLKISISTLSLICFENLKFESGSDAVRKSQILLQVWMRLKNLNSKMAPVQKSQFQNLNFKSLENLNLKISIPNPIQNLNFKISFSIHWKISFSNLEHASVKKSQILFQKS